jgi:hypothetical protein
MRAELHFQQQLQRDLRESAADAALAAARAAMEPVDGCVHAGCVPGHAAAPVPDLDGCTPSTRAVPHCTLPCCVGINRPAILFLLLLQSIYSNMA